MENMEYVPAKTIVTKMKAPQEWFGIDYNMNIYRGCSHGCIYCDSRSDCYHVEQFDQVKAKENALEIIRNELRRKARKGVVGTGAMSDPYNPFEKSLCLTRHSLELIEAFGFGASLTTKSPLITRDIDILTSIREQAPVIAGMTITTCDDALSRKIEPRVSVSSKRFEALFKLSEAGIYAGILMMPVLPFLEDQESNVMGIVRQAQECGVKFIYPAFGMTMREGQRDWFYQALLREFPDQNLPERYRKQYGNRYQCTSPKARKLWQIFTKACEAAKIRYQMKDIIYGYKHENTYQQMSLFDS